MSIITLTELATYKGVPEASLPAQAQGWLDSAETMVAARIGAWPDMVELGSRALSFTPVRDTKMIIPNYGPVASVQNLTLDGSAITTTIEEIFPWLIRVDTAIPAGCEVTGIFTTGYPNYTQMPLEIRAAVFGIWETYSSGFTAGIQNLRIGDWAASYSGGMSIDDAYGHLLSRYTKAPVV